jgi:DNA-binding NarL/FixJ family response regulator
MRVVIAEDSGLLRQLLAELFTARGLEVTGLAQTLPEVLRLVEADPPDIVVLDIRMPPDYRDEGLQAAEALRARYPDVGLLILSHYAETSYAVRLLEISSHAVGYLVKDRVQDADRLLEAASRVASGEIVIDPEVVQRLLLRPRRADPLANLTSVEKQVLALIAEGYSNAAIGKSSAIALKPSKSE